MSERYQPDFIERNGTWVLSMVGVLSACLSGVFAYFLRSRCTTVKFCGIHCERRPIELNNEQVAVVEQR